PVVGWIGSPTTASYIRTLSNVFQRVHRDHAFRLRISGIEPLEVPGIVTDNAPWSLAGEVALFNTCDVGVYPLSDDEWARGKCGFKAIQFMACGVPVVAAPVGVNREIITDGVNGLLASTPDEWVEKLRRLVADAALRARGAIDLDLSLHFILRRRQIERADVLVMSHTIDPSHAWILDAAREYGVPLVYDIDENLLEPPDDEPGLDFHRAPGRRAAVL